ncbi:MAG TPA: hypothetical protein VHG88_08115 [Burkholderiales bacterium]|nr:hypothetical protein [Burkholderiales bacterium]
MQHLKPGDLVALEHAGKHYVFLVLSRSAFFGCQWTFAFHRTFPEVPAGGSINLSGESGFVALIDFIEPRRANTVARISKGLDPSPHLAFTRTKALIRQGVLGPPLWYIYDRAFRILKQEPALAEEELDYPIGSGMKAHEAFELVDARWRPRVLVDPSIHTGQYPRRPKF